MADIKHLSRGFAWGDPIETMQEASKYAQDPPAYLVEKKGGEWFEKHKADLSLPSLPIDRDVYGNGKHKTDFEQHVAKLLGKKHCLFIATGVQAQTIATKIYCDRAKKNIVSFHRRSHLEIHEQLSYKHLFGLEFEPLGEDYFTMPTLQDVQRLVELPTERRPAILVLELPNRELGCATYSFSDLEKISVLCRGARIKLHCDGARLWEIEPFYAQHGKSYKDIAALFDSVYLSFYKGLGGVSGAMLLSDDESFIHETRSWVRRCGGNVVTLFFEIIDCERGLNENFGSFAGRREKMMKVQRAIEDATRTFLRPDSTEPIVTFATKEATCNQVHTHITGFTEKEIDAAKERVKTALSIEVFSRVRAFPTAEEFDKAKHFPPGGYNPKANSDATTIDRKHYFFEWQIGSPNESIAVEDYEKGWRMFCEELQNARKSL